MDQFYLGTLLAQTKKLDLAKPLLLKAIQIQPNYADAHNNFGNVLKELGEYKDAINSCEKAIQIQPNLKCPLQSWSGVRKIR